MLPILELRLSRANGKNQGCYGSVGETMYMAKGPRPREDALSRAARPRDVDLGLADCSLEASQ
jgi:hypothetical protein